MHYYSNFTEDRHDRNEVFVRQTLNNDSTDVSAIHAAKVDDLLNDLETPLATVEVYEDQAVIKPAITPALVAAIAQYKLRQAAYEDQRRRFKESCQPSRKPWSTLMSSKVHRSNFKLNYDVSHSTVYRRFIAGERREDRLFKPVDQPGAQIEFEGEYFSATRFAKMASMNKALVVAMARKGKTGLEILEARQKPGRPKRK
jgi:hypothetical protein